MDILLVEDETPKREHISRFIKEGWPKASVRLARSVRTAVTELCSNQPDLLLLDMSLPTFDIGPGEPGGRPQGFGGVEVLRYMDLNEILTPTIVVTAYPAFSKDGKEIDHETLSAQLLKEHPATYRGLIYYSSLYSAWRTELSDVILQTLGYGQKA